MTLQFTYLCFRTDSHSQHGQPNRQQRLDAPHIADGHHVDVASGVFRIGFAFAADANAAEVDLFVRGLAHLRRRADLDSYACQGRSFEKITARQILRHGKTPVDEQNSRG